MRRWIPLFTVLLSLIASMDGQNTSSAKNSTLESHGTCATVVLGKPGIAFVIDSKVTETSGGLLVGQHTGCKVLLPRPTILIAGIGVEDTTSNVGHWNSLDSASVALKDLPEVPTAAQIDHRGANWAQTLISHFRGGSETPPLVGVVSEVLLITKLESSP